MTSHEHWAPAYLGVGSNLSEPAAQVRRAIAALDGLPRTRLVASSPSYGNPPMGPQDQPDYVNAVAGVLTQLEPVELLQEILALEAQLGRVRTPEGRWGPRIIDLDLLVHGSRVEKTDTLTLPHPGISERNFVLFPLRDIAPTLVVPGQGVIARLAQHVSTDGLAVIGNAVSDNNE
ncbi:MAG: 2-amino-4-hydroxy-6-hydroxymethyldihydropteridine diphosphokinase [Gammaproteobacteria bacterium]|nr:2-amino-4-hydroxy-6-hydroxymethyldihydropteridine diphosphokinase [Gammaproteobacteria bacterium]